MREFKQEEHKRDRPQQDDYYHVARLGLRSRRQHLEGNDSWEEAYD